MTAWKALKSVAFEGMPFLLGVLGLFVIVMLLFSDIGKDWSQEKQCIEYVMGSEGQKIKDPLQYSKALNEPYETCKSWTKTKMILEHKEQHSNE